MTAPRTSICTTRTADSAPPCCPAPERRPKRRLWGIRRARRWCCATRTAESCFRRHKRRAPDPRGLVLNSGGRTRTDDPRIMNLGPSGWRRGQEVFDGERIGGAPTRAAAVRCRPEADALQTGMLRRLSGERLTILKPMGRVSEVIRFGNVIDLGRTERRQRGVRIIQNALEELIVCGACRIDVAVEIYATGRWRQAVINHEFQAPIHEEHGTMPIQDGEKGIDIRIVEHNGLC